MVPQRYLQRSTNSIKMVPQHFHPSSNSTSNSLLLFIAFLTFAFLLLKMPMDIKTVSRVAPHTIDDLYNRRAPHSAVDQRIDAKRSYHFFNRKRRDMSQKQIQEDQELAQEVDKIMRHHNLDMEERRNLRSGADDNVADRLKNVVRRYLGAKKHSYVGGIPHERKEEDPYDSEITKEIQDIVKHHYHDADEV
jgi:hypothetical protein